MSTETLEDSKKNQPAYSQFKLSDESEKAFLDALASDAKVKASPPPEKPKEQPIVETPPSADAPAPVSDKKDDSIPPSIKSTKAADDWKRLKSELETKREEARKLQEEIEKIRNLPKDNSELDSLRKEYDQLSEQVRLLGIERHPKFQKFFGDKINQVHNDLKSILGEEKATRAFRILNMDESEHKKELLRDLVSDMDEFQREDLLFANRTLRAINHEKAAEIEKAKSDWDNIRQKELQEEEKKKKSYLDIFSNVLSQAKALPVFQEKDGDAEWNKSVSERIKLAQTLYNGSVPPDELAKAALWSASAPFFLEQGKALMEENARLKKELEEMRAATPKIDGGGESQAPEMESSGDYRKDIEARARNIRFGG